MGVILSGTLRCPVADAPALRSALPDHIELTRAEPGYLSFEVVETAPGLFTVSEALVDDPAIEAHQARMRASAWGNLTAGMERADTITRT